MLFKLNNNTINTYVLMLYHIHSSHYSLHTCNLKVQFAFHGKTWWRARVWTLSNYIELTDSRFKWKLQLGDKREGAADYIEWENVKWRERVWTKENIHTHTYTYIHKHIYIDGALWTIGSLFRLRRERHFG